MMLMAGNSLGICICNTCLLVYSPVQGLEPVDHERSNNQSHLHEMV